MKLPGLVYLKYLLGCYVAFIQHIPSPKSFINTQQSSSEYLG